MNLNNNIRIKVCTFFSDSHVCLYREFMNSFLYEEGIDLTIRYIPQDCEGTYECKNWNKAMYNKMDYIVSYLSNLNSDDILIHADIDIKFYKSFRQDIINLLDNLDIIFQDDGCSLCMGFFACRKSQKIIELMTNIRDNLDNYQNDQDALNKTIHQTPIKYSKLPSRYYSFGPLNGLKVWTPNYTNIIVPKDIILHHANWTVGVDNKIKLMNEVEKIYRHI